MNKRDSSTIERLHLNRDNYYTNHSSWDYMSVSQYKRFEGCEAAALAELKQEFVQDMDKKPLLVGNYVHSYFESPEEHEKFKEENKDKMFSKRSPFGLLKDFQIAEQMIKRVEREPFFNYLWQGESEHIVTGELFGVHWKGRIDKLNVEKGYFVDLKTTMQLGKRFYSKKYGGYVSFIEEYGYVLQMAVYEKLLEKEFGKPFTGYIYAVTKETPSDVAAIRTEQTRIEFELDRLEKNIERINGIKNGEIKPEYCGTCEYCRENKTLENFITPSELI